ncbi:hypothetical protein VB773_08385 [Haloarculaceae archaeon H-GB2-1]|nr:hypothetical protein [Haloarculaceae archaeon H-GB1-1]MEA5386075.1 hypothetical protein [Haloarculaceae archaeon H-GB11]MEA5407582.1 hypothetical protein [Haloarculaceae archaeon H-GB2-1]
MDVLGDLVARDRRSEDIALRRASRAGSYSYAKLCTNAWKAGNLLRHYGVRGGAEVAVALPEGDPTPPVVTGFFGAMLLGAPVRFVASGTVDAKALLVPTDRVTEFDAEPGCTVLAYGDEPDAATVVHFEREVWSENPTAPPDVVEADAVALRTGDETFTHADLLARMETAVDERGLTASSEQHIDGSLATPDVLVDCLLAPLSVGATVVLEDSE